MKNPLRLPLKAGLLLALAGATRCPALAPTEWQHRQAVMVPAPGLVRVELTPASFDAAAPRQEDLRLLDPSGGETAFLLDHPPAHWAHALRPSAFAVRVESGSTVILITTGTAEKLSLVSLETPSPFFLRAAKVEISENNADWVAVEEGTPVFREWGAEKLQLSLGNRVAAFVRVTLADEREPALPFTGASLISEDQPAPATLPLNARISSREEFAGETVLTLALDGRHLPLAALEFETKEPLFMRRVTVGVREVRDDAPAERTIGGGTLYRVAIGGAPAREQLQLPLHFAPDTRELLIHIYNGDSPPLAIDAVRPRRWPVSLLFLAPKAGSYSLLSGNPQAAAPRYDLAAFAGEMRGATATVVVAGSLEDTPDYHPSAALGTAPLPDVPLAGAPLDTAEWPFRRAVLIAEPGVQELELDLEALAKSRPDFGDLRLLHEGNQIPYVLEQPALSHSLEVPPESVPDAKRGSLSVWKIRLPKAGLPIRSVALTTTTPLFERQFRIYEKMTGEDGGAYETTLGSGAWSRTPRPGVPERHVFGLPERMRTDTLWIECDNGDNPAIALGAVQVVYPVVRLVFKVAETGGFELAYGNRAANAPRYDLSLVAGRLLTANRSRAHLSPDEPGAPARNPFGALSGGYIFWGALALVVAALLVVVAKALPKLPS